MERLRKTLRKMRSFSALQRAENSSILRSGFLYQLSFESFSALQRAENSSMHRQTDRQARAWRFQCSSASRKFLNSRTITPITDAKRVSVLFSEPKIPQCSTRSYTAFSAFSVSVLFSEPKIPQLPYSPTPATRRASVSVLFSEPKIPQWTNSLRCTRQRRGFSALQRAENSSITAD